MGAEERRDESSAQPQIIRLTPAKPSGLLVVLLLALTGIVAYSVFRPTAMARPSWQYKIQAVDDASFEAQMGLLGAAGWELVFARRASAGDGGPMAYECIFKRAE